MLPPPNNYLKSNRFSRNDHLACHPIKPTEPAKLRSTIFFSLLVALAMTTISISARASTDLTCDSDQVTADDTDRQAFLSASTPDPDGAPTIPIEILRSATGKVSMVYGEDFRVPLSGQGCSSGSYSQKALCFLDRFKSSFGLTDVSTELTIFMERSIAVASKLAKIIWVGRMTASDTLARSNMKPCTRQAGTGVAWTLGVEASDDQQITYTASDGAPWQIHGYGRY